MTEQTAQEIEVLIRARYPLIYIVSWEEARVDRLLWQLAEKRQKKVFVWSISRGIVPHGTSLQSKKHSDEGTKEPSAALDRVAEAVEPALYVFHDFHHFIQEPLISRKLRELAQHLKGTYTTLVFVSPRLCVPDDLEKDIAIVEFGMPTTEELDDLLTRTIREVNESAGVNLQLDAGTKERLVQSALGLTMNEAENVFAKTIVKDGKLDQDSLATILSEKEQIIRRSGLLEYYRAEEGFGEVGGLGNLKAWLSKRSVVFSDKARKAGLPAPKGVLLVGVQGCGKSLCAKALSSLWQVPLLRFDLGKVFSGLVGSSEANIRNATQVAESVAPAIMWVDEIEKAFAGTQSSGASDGGTTARVFGTFLTWLQEKTAPVFVMCTANSIEQLPPELLRKGRMDEIFFIDLPAKTEREQIFRIHLEKRDQDAAAFDVLKLVEESQGFSGAEIEQAIIAAMFDVFSEDRNLDTDSVVHSLQDTVPLSRTMKEQIDYLRDWAKTRARRASEEESEEVVPIAGRKLEL